MDTNESSRIIINYVPCNCNESGKLDFSGVHILSNHGVHILSNHGVHILSNHGVHILSNHVLCCFVYTSDLLQIK